MQNSKYCSVHIGYEEETNKNDEIMEETMTEDVKAPTNSRSTSLAGTYSNSQSSGSSGGSHGSLIERFEVIEKNLNALLAMQGKKTKTEKKPRKMTEKGALRSATFIFYNEHKKDEDIIASVVGGLKDGKMFVMKRVIEDGEEVLKPQVPWLLIKLATDIKFYALNEAEKGVYVKKAYEKNAKVE